MKKALPLTFILIGAALLITAVVFWIDSNTSTEPQSFGKTLLDWVTLIAGLGASIKGWMDLFKPDKPTPPTTKIEVNGENRQISTGDHARNIQAETYIENQTVQQPPEPKTPKSLNQLPAPPLDFIGREKELAHLHQNIEKGIVISGVQGMGGIGKTALGLKLAEQISRNYPEGQIYLDLRGAHEQTPLTPEQVMAHVIRSFHPETSLPLDFGELGAMYRSVLNGKNVLLFYDNARDEKQLDTLLPPKSCTLFVTSRQYFTLPGLVAMDLETLAPRDAIELVQEISSRVSNKDAETLASLCGFLPLAIRAAVSVLPRRPDWSAAELIKRLGDNRARLGLVESSLSLSYDALNDELQKYLFQLGVFAAPFDKDAILAVWFGDNKSTSRTLRLELGTLSTFNDDSDSEKITIQKVEEILGNLLKTSLLQYDSIRDEYRLHDLTHLYLENKLLQYERSSETLWRFANYYLELSAQLETEYLNGGEHLIRALARFRRNWVHLSNASERLALGARAGWKKPLMAERWLIQSALRIGEILRNSFSPKEYVGFIQRGLFASKNAKNQASEAMYLNFLGLAYAALGDAQRSIKYFQQALDIHHNIGDENGRYLPLGNLGLAYNKLGDGRHAIDYYNEAIEIAHAVGDRRNEGEFIGGKGAAYYSLGDMYHAVENYKQALEIAREIGDKQREGVWLGNLGGAFFALGKAHEAIEYYEQSLSVAREIGDHRSEGIHLGGMGGAYLALGDEHKAIDCYQQSLAIVRNIGDRYAEVTILGNLGFLMANNQKSTSQEYIQDALRLAQEIGDKHAEAYMLSTLAGVKRQQGELQEAITLHQKALQLSDETGDVYAKCQILDNMANAYADLDEGEKAIESYLSAMQIATDESLSANIAWNLATVYNEQERYDLAAKYMQITVDFEKKINHPNANADLEALNKVRAKIQSTIEPEEQN